MDQKLCGKALPNGSNAIVYAVNLPADENAYEPIKLEDIYAKPYEPDSAIYFATNRWNKFASDHKDVETEVDEDCWTLPARHADFLRGFLGHVGDHQWPMVTDSFERPSPVPATLDPDLIYVVKLKEV